jgi:hypothetical protein
MLPDGGLHACCAGGEFEWSGAQACAREKIAGEHAREQMSALWVCDAAA